MFFVCFVLPACAGRRAGGGVHDVSVMRGWCLGSAPRAVPRFLSLPEPAEARSRHRWRSDCSRVAPGPRNTAGRLRVRVAPLSPTTRITNTLVRAIGQQSRPIVLRGRHVMRCTACDAEAGGGASLVVCHTKQPPPTHQVCASRGLRQRRGNGKPLPEPQAAPTRRAERSDGLNVAAGDEHPVVAEKVPRHSNARVYSLSLRTLSSW